MAARPTHTRAAPAVRGPPHDRRRRAARRALGHGALAAPPRLRRGRRRRRGRPRRLRRAAGRRRLRAAGRPARPRAGAGRLQAAHRRGARAGLRRGRRPGRRLVGRRHPGRGTRRPRHARDQHRGAAPGGLRRSTPAPDYVLTDGFPVSGLAAARPGRVEGRPGGRLRRRGLRAGQGDPGPDDAGAARALARVRLRRAQGLHHRRAQRGPRAARPLPGAPDALRQRAHARGTAHAARAPPR